VFAGDRTVTDMHVADRKVLSAAAMVITWPPRSTKLPPRGAPVVAAGGGDAPCAAALVGAERAGHVQLRVLRSLRVSRVETPILILSALAG
jgi:hypothetical protein